MSMAYVRDNDQETSPLKDFISRTDKAAKCWLWTSRSHIARSTKQKSINAANHDPTLIADTYAENVKNKKYKVSVESDDNQVFTPVVITEVGSINKDGIELLHKIARARSARTGVTYYRTVKYLFTEISAALVRSQYSSIAKRRHPDEMKEKEIQQIWVK